MGIKGYAYQGLTGFSTGSPPVLSRDSGHLDDKCISRVKDFPVSSHPLQIPRIHLGALGADRNEPPPSSQAWDIRPCCNNGSAKRLIKADRSSIPRSGKPSRDPSPSQKDRRLAPSSPSSINLCRLSDKRSDGSILLQPTDLSTPQTRDISF